MIAPDRSTRSMLPLRRSAVALCSVALIAAALTVAPAAASTHFPESASDAFTAAPGAEVLTENLRIRAELGLPATRADVSEVLTAEGLSLRSGAAALSAEVNEWGFIGTVEEAQEIERRNKLVSAVETAETDLAALPGFAGHYLDNANGGTLVVQFEHGTTPTELFSSLQTAARSAGSDASDVEFREVEHSSAALTDTMHAIWDEAERGGYIAGIASIAEDPITNSLDITLADESVSELVQDTSDAAGIPVALDVNESVGDLACTSRTACDSPRRGGVGIDRAGGSCTTGWVMVRNGVRGAVTAGHCWYGTNAGNVNSGSAAYGSLSSTNALAADGTHADMRWINIPSNAQPWIYSTNSLKQNVVTGQSLGSVGASVCQFGRNSASPRCGTISSTNVSHFSNTANKTVYGQSRGTFAGSGGDSGGSVAVSSAGGTARGTVSFGGAQWVNYSWIGYASQYNLGSLLTN